MLYAKLSELPDAVKDNLPKHAQEIYKEAFNHAWDEYADPDERRGDASRCPGAAGHGEGREGLVGELGLLQAEHVGVGGRDEIAEPFAERRADAVDVPGEDLRVTHRQLLLPCTNCGQLLQVIATSWMLQLLWLGLAAQQVNGHQPCVKCLVNIAPRPASGASLCHAVTNLLRSHNVRAHCLAGHPVC